METQLPANDSLETAESAAVPARDAAFWTAVNDDAIALIDSLISKCRANFDNGINFYLSHMRGIINTQGKELAIFRELETHIRQETLNPELLVDIISRMDTLRIAAASDVAARNKAASEGKPAT